MFQSFCLLSGPYELKALERAREREREEEKERKGDSGRLSTMWKEVVVNKKPLISTLKYKTINEHFWLPVPGRIWES